MTQKYSYGAGAAAGYNDAFAHVSNYFVPFLVRAARLRPGDKVLDVATGTGIAAEAALALIGASGSVVAADVSRDMVAKARERLARASNASFAVEDGQTLSFPDQTFDVVMCSSGLMFFPEPARGLSQFRRVLVPGGRVAVSVAAASPDLSYNGRINIPLAHHVPGLAETNARYFAVGEPARLVAMLEAAGFEDVETHAERHTFTLPSFDAYYGPYERGAGSTGQTLATLSEEARRAVREAVRRNLGDTGGPVDVPVEVRYASGRRPA